MGAFTIVLKNVLIFVLLAIPGWILVKTKKADGAVAGVLSKILVSVAMPFLIIGSVAKITFDAASLWLLAISAVIGIGYHYILLILSRYVAGKGKSAGAERFCMIFSNNGFLGLPLAMAIFGSDSPVLTCVIVVNILTNILMQTEGVAVIGEKAPVRSWKVLKNPLLISFAIGVVVNLSGIFKAIPESVTYCNYLSGLVTPLSMLIIGIQLGQSDLRKLLTTGKMYFVAAMKLVATPGLIVGALVLVGLIAPVPRELIIGMFIAFAMPTAGLAPVYAGMHGGDTESAVCCTIGSTVLSVVTIPGLYWILSLLLGA